jgi:TolB-like protein
LSNDPEQEYFADAVTDELTTDLSRISDSFVIARTTAFTYKNKPIDVKQIGRDLGVRYVLEGTIRRSGNEVRVSGQLIDAETGAHVWAEWFDGHTSDLFALQDEITSQIASTFSSQLIRAEASRPTENPDALDYIFRGRAAFLKPASRGTRTEQVDWFERALTIDPESVEAQANLATALSARVLDDMTDSPTADVARAERLAENALAASPHSSVAHYARGQVLRAQRRYAEAASEYEAALASNRSWAFAMFALGQCKLYTGSIEETIPLTERAIRFSPREPQIGMWYFQIGEVYLLQSRTDEATLWLEKARNATPAAPYIRAWLASAYALKGETVPAAAELAMARKLSADTRYSNLPRLRAYFDWLAPSVRTLFEATYFVGLRKAGMSDE